MKIKKIKVPFYKWVIISIVAETFDDKDAVIKKMKSLRIVSDYIDEVEDKFDSKATGGANCYYNDGRLLCIIVTFPHKSAKEYASTLIHEGRHAADRIIDTTGIEGAEATAYLTEFVTTEIVKDYIKDETYRVES